MSATVTSPAKPTSIWRNKSFSMLLGSVLFMTIGNKIYEIVLPLIMYEITRSSVSMASMRTAELLPNLLFAVFIGVIVDRVNKKRWVLWMTAAQALLLFSFVYLFKTNTQNLYLYYMIGFLLMTFNYGFFNAQTSLTKLSVSPEHLTSANAKFSFVETFVGIMGPTLSGLILMLADLSDGILITGCLYLFCLLLLARLSVVENIPFEQKASFWIELHQGWRAFTSNPNLWMVTIFVIFLNCTMTVVSTTIIFFAKDDLKLSSSILAVVLSTSGIGGLAGSLLANWLRSRIGLGKIFGLGALLNGIGYLGLYLTTNVISVMFWLVLIGFALSMHTISVYTLRHEQTPAHLMGRISGITGTLFRFGMPIAMYFSGWMIVWWGTSSIFISSAIWNLLAFAVMTRTRVWRIS